MSLAIIIVSWNTRELTLRCLKSIFKSIKNIDFKVYLIDNNSTDGTIEAIQKLFGLKTGVITNNVYVTPSFSSDRLEIIANQENVGFAKANNQAINLCHPRESEDLMVKRSPIESGMTKILLVSYIVFQLALKLPKNFLILVFILASPA